MVLDFLFRTPPQFLRAIFASEVRRVVDPDDLRRHHVSIVLSVHKYGMNQPG